MRKFFVIPIVLVIAMIGLASCEGSYHYSPYIAFSSFLKNPVLRGDSIVGCEDTISVAYDENLNAYVLDSVCRGDTVAFAVAFDARGNNLKSAQIKADTLALDIYCHLNQKIREILLTSSSDKDMYWEFKSGYSGVCFPVFYVPQKLGSHSMVFTVTSDSKYSPATITVIQNVKE